MMSSLETADLFSFVCVVKMVRLLLLLLATAWMFSEASISLSRTQSLRMAIILFRHGDRSPISTYRTDPYKNYPWIGGFLALQPVNYFFFLLHKPTVNKISCRKE